MSRLWCHAIRMPNWKPTYQVWLSLINALDETFMLSNQTVVITVFLHSFYSESLQSLPPAVYLLGHHLERKVRNMLCINFFEYLQKLWSISLCFIIKKLTWMFECVFKTFQVCLDWHKMSTFCEMTILILKAWKNYG